MHPPPSAIWRPFLLLWLIRLGLRPVKRGAALDGGKSRQFSIKSTQDSPRLNCSIAFLSITSHYLSPLIFNTQFNMSAFPGFESWTDREYQPMKYFGYLLQKFSIDFSKNMFVPKPTLLTINVSFRALRVYLRCLCYVRWDDLWMGRGVRLICWLSSLDKAFPPLNVTFLRNLPLHAGQWVWSCV